MDAGHRVLRYDDHTTDPGPDDNGGIFLHALDAYWDVFLVALFLDRLQRTHLDQGGALQPGSGGQYLQRAGGESVDRDPRDPGFGAEDCCHGSVGAFLPVPIDSAGNRTEGTSERDHKNLVYRETDAIGHPLSSLTGIVAGTGLLCPSETTSFFPYFQSGLDALSWRQEIPEIFYPASLIPGLRELGTWPLQTWGGVYPRTGWTTQSEEPKAAALNAQRAGDIVTRTGQPHVYVPVTGSSGSMKVWSPGPLMEKDLSTGTWQMLLPLSESSCNVFGTNDLASLTGWGGGRVDSEGDYVWNLWRPYKCCERRGQWFLFDIDWIAYP